MMVISKTEEGRGKGIEKEEKTGKKREKERQKALMEKRNMMILNDSKNLKGKKSI